MKSVVFLTLNRSGVVKMTKEKPALARDQRAVRLSVTVPDTAFTAPPILDAQLDVPADAVIQPANEAPIDVEIWR